MSRLPFPTCPTNSDFCRQNHNEKTYLACATFDLMGIVRVGGTHRRRQEFSASVVRPNISSDCRPRLQEWRNEMFQISGVLSRVGARNAAAFCALFAAVPFSSASLQAAV